MTVLVSTKSLRLATEKGNLPPAVLGDPLRIAQILYNLLSNAIKFTEQGEVCLSARREGETLVFAVRDTGVGIPPQVLSRLFQPFEQADSSVTRKFGGTGLGLTISRRLAGLMGGTLDVESAPGQGSTFSLRLPLRETDQPALPGKGQLVTGTKRLAGLHLLVAEDNAVNQLVIDDLLRGEGAEVAMAGNGQEALDLVARTEQPFDAVLMDVQMPVMDGLEATRQLRLSHPELAVIGQTAYALKEEIDKCLAAGMAATVNKPIELEILVSTLHEHLPATRLTAVASAQTRHEASPSGTTVIDWAGFGRRYPNRAYFIDRLASLFLQEHAEEGKQLRALSAASDIVGIEKIAHDLKGAAGNVFATEVQALALSTLANARQKNPATLKQAKDLADAVDRATEALRQGRPEDCPGG